MLQLRSLVDVMIGKKILVEMILIILLLALKAKCPLKPMSSTMVTCLIQRLNKPVVWLLQSNFMIKDVIV
jgi:hypothetical protein